MMGEGPLPGTCGSKSTLYSIMLNEVTTLSLMRLQNATFLQTKQVHLARPRKEQVGKSISSISIASKSVT